MRVEFDRIGAGDAYVYRLALMPWLLRLIVLSVWSFLDGSCQICYHFLYLDKAFKCRLDVVEYRYLGNTSYENYP